MNRFFVLIAAFVLLVAFASPANAQTSFFDDLRANLSSSTSTSAEPAPTVARPNARLGASEGATSTVPSDVSASGNALYVAGSDTWSAPIAGVAAVLSILLIGIIIWFLLGHREHREP